MNFYYERSGAHYDPYESQAEDEYIRLMDAFYSRLGEFGGDWLAMAKSLGLDETADQNQIVTAFEKSVNPPRESTATFEPTPLPQTKQ